MQDSPIQLTEDQKKERYEQKVKDFMAGYDALCNRMGMCFVPQLEMTRNGIIPKNIPMYYKPEDKK
jgi:hypothetical protein